MNRRRELTLQRVSRIGGIAAVDNIPQNTKYRNNTTDTRTIEAALGTFMMRNNEVYGVNYQDTYTQNYGSTGQNEHGQLAGQMEEYKTALDESKLSEAKSELESRRAAERLNIKKFEEALAKDPSAQYQLSRYKKKDNKSDYDALDANRCSGFLLYSYDKNGVHSVLGEHLYGFK